MRAPARAFVAHRTPTRLRIKLASARGMPADFVSIKRHLLEHPDIVAVQLNRLTASVVIECRRGFELTPGHQQLLGLDMQARSEQRSTHHRPACLAPDDNINDLAGTLILAHMLRLIVAISTGRVGAQLVEWIAEGLIQAAKSEAQRRVAQHKAQLRMAVR